MGTRLKPGAEAGRTPRAKAGQRRAQFLLLGRAAPAPAFVLIVLINEHSAPHNSQVLTHGHSRLTSPAERPWTARALLPARRRAWPGRRGEKGRRQARSGARCGPSRRQHRRPAACTCPAAPPPAARRPLRTHPPGRGREAPAPTAGRATSRGATWRGAAGTTQAEGQPAHGDASRAPGPRRPGNGQPGSAGGAPPPSWELAAAAGAILVSGGSPGCGRRGARGALKEPSTRRFRSSRTFPTAQSWAGSQRTPVARFLHGLGGAWLLAAHTRPPGAVFPAGNLGAPPSRARPGRSCPPLPPCLGLRDKIPDAQLNLNFTEIMKFFTVRDIPKFNCH